LELKLQRMQRMQRTQRQQRLQPLAKIWAGYMQKCVHFVTKSRPSPYMGLRGRDIEAV
jgi:hypothetical protein